MIGISACLGGVCCRYDGGQQEIASLKQLIAAQQAIMICPEVLGGLSTPRNPAEIIDGDGFDVWQGVAKVVDNMGADVTEAFKNGARRAYQQLLEQEVTCLIMKERSPSCGAHSIYDGTFSGNKKTGTGVATAYFINKGLQVLSEEEWLSKGEKLNGN